MIVLGIEVDDNLVGRWRSWLMPQTQPFVVPRDLADERKWTDGAEMLSFEMLDAFELYTVLPTHTIVWLERSQARSLPENIRRAQPTPHRWPTANPARDAQQAVRYVEYGRRPSRHGKVSEEDWESVEGLLPGAKALAGTFPSHSGPNCFGTVMGAAGVIDAGDEWMQPEPFEHWLKTHTHPGGDDNNAGTILVWRNTAGQPTHAAVTLGSGWLLHKPSQGWMSPTKVLTVQEGKYSARQRGRTLSRHRFLGAAS